MIVPWKNPEVIILRKRKKHRGSPGELAEYTDTPFTRIARRNLENINTFIARHHIDLDITDDQEEALLLRLRGRDDGYIDYTKTRLVRIFNNSSFEQGGRYYGGWWQGIPGDWRTFITINSKRTVQLDYLRDALLDHVCQYRHRHPHDRSLCPEGFRGHLRGNIKTAFNIIINCSPARRPLPPSMDAFEMESFRKN